MDNEAAIPWSGLASSQHFQLDEWVGGDHSSSPEAQSSESVQHCQHPSRLRGVWCCHYTSMTSDQSGLQVFMETGDTTLGYEALERIINIMM